eukprot:180322-Chlamydomonas_euryale.AAC.1
MQDAHQQAPGDVLVRLVSHAVQTVLLFSVMMGELVMAQVRYGASPVVGDFHTGKVLVASV